MLIWIIKIQIPCLDSLKKAKDLDLTNLPRILNFESFGFEITSNPIKL